MSDYVFTEEELAKITKVVAGAPPLTPEQIEKLRPILAPSTTTDPAERQPRRRAA